jgi:erythromycin esterase-like protein
MMPLPRRCGTVAVEKSMVLVRGAALALIASALSLAPAGTTSRVLVVQSAPEAGTERALDSALHDLCSRQIVFLGENGFHGDGRAQAFRAALIERLVHDCGFGAVFFEASHYDFLAIERAARRRQPITSEMVSSAIGGKWNQDREIDSLVHFLAEAAGTGRVTLGGLDDQVGVRGAFYSNETMPAELAAFLPPQRGEQCHRLLEQRLSAVIPKDMTRENYRAAVTQCLDEMRGAIGASRRVAKVDRAEYLEMVDNFERCVSREGLSLLDYSAARDRSMFLNLRWLKARLLGNAKIVIWTENAHARKDAGPMTDSSGSSLGFYVHRAYGTGAFSLGSTAAGGSYRWDARTTRPIPPAPPGSVEATMLAASPDNAVYVAPARLREFGKASAAAFDDHLQKVAPWHTIYDALIVFHDERPPSRKDGT